MSKPKLNKEIADEIRVLYFKEKKNGMTQLEVAQLYGISPHSVSKIINNEAWTNGGKRKLPDSFIQLDEASRNRKKIDDVMELAGSVKYWIRLQSDVKLGLFA